MTSEQEFTQSWQLAEQLQAGGWEIVSKSKDGSNWYLAKHASHPDVALEKYKSGERCGVAIQMDGVELHGAAASFESRMQHAQRLLDLAQGIVPAQVWVFGASILAAANVRPRTKVHRMYISSEQCGAGRALHLRGPFIHEKDYLPKLA